MSFWAFIGITIGIIFIFILILLCGIEGGNCETCKHCAWVNPAEEDFWSGKITYAYKCTKKNKVCIGPDNQCSLFEEK